MRETEPSAVVKGNAVVNGNAAEAVPPEGYLIVTDEFEEARLEILAVRRLAKNTPHRILLSRDLAQPGTRCERV